MSKETQKLKKEEKFYGTGRRKTAVAKVWLWPGEGKFFINGVNYEDYVFKRKFLVNIILKPLQVTELLGKLNLRVTAEGGGISSQAGAISLGIARALLEYDPELKNVLRENGLLTRDPRAKERKKYGRKRARRSFQFTKR